MVRSDAEDDAEFVASRIVVKPAAAEEDVEAEEAAEETEDAAEETTEDAAATDA